MATRTILFRGQTRRKGERTSISGIPLPGIWVAGGVFIYHEASKEDPEKLPAGWYIDDKDYTTFSIATDPEAVKYLKAPLKNGGYSFEERKAFWDSFLDFKAPKLRLPVKIAKRSGCKL